jgi:hypothetical protein
MATAVLALLVSGLLTSCGGGANGFADTEPERAAPMTAVAITPEEAARQLMDYGESVYPELFPGHETTQSLPPFVYRHYAATGTYLGVVIADGSGLALDGVYVKGGPFGDVPRFVGQLTDFVTPVDPASVVEFDGNYSGTMAILATVDPGGVGHPTAFSFSFSISHGAVGGVIVNGKSGPGMTSDGSVSPTGAIDFVLHSDCAAVTWTGVDAISASGTVATGNWDKPFVPTPPGADTCPGFSGTWTATRVS